MTSRAEYKDATSAILKIILVSVREGKGVLEIVCVESMKGIVVVECLTLIVGRKRDPYRVVRRNVIDVEMWLS